MLANQISSGLVSERHMSYKRVKLKIKPLLVLLATTLIGAQVSSATIIMIDAFQTAEATATLTAPGTAHNAANLTPGEALGNFRILDSVFITGPARTLDFKSEGSPLSDLALNSGNGVTGAGLATYCGSIACGTASFTGSISSITPTTFGLGSVDLTAGGVNTQIRIIGNTDLNVTVTATFYIDSTHYAQATYALLGSLVNRTEILRFDNTGDAPFVFTGVGTNASLFTHVNAITFLIQG